MVTNTEEYTQEIEELFIRFLVSDPEIFVRVKNIISPRYFDDVDNRKVVKFLLEYTDEYPSMPTDDQVKAIAGKIFEKMLPADVTEHTDWFMKQFERFCQHKAAKQVIYDSMDLVRDHNHGEILRRMKEVTEMGIIKDLGVDYFSKPKERLEKMRDRSNMISTGWKSIDNKLYGGLEKGTITIWAGQCVVGDTEVRTIKIHDLDKYFSQHEQCKK